MTPPPPIYVFFQKIWMLVIKTFLTDLSAPGMLLWTQPCEPHEKSREPAALLGLWTEIVASVAYVRCKAWTPPACFISTGKIIQSRSLWFILWTVSPHHPCISRVFCIDIPLWSCGLWRGADCLKYFSKLAVFTVKYAIHISLPSLSFFLPSLLCQPLLHYLCLLRTPWTCSALKAARIPVLMIDR